MRFFVLLLALLAAPAFARLDPERFVVVQFDRVYDGDTVVVRMPALPAPLDKLRVRIQGIDTPEIGKGARCDAEVLAGDAARDYLTELMEGAAELRVYGFRWDKYGGRLLGDLRVPQGSVRDLMIRSGHAVPYGGEGARRDWCADPR